MFLLPECYFTKSIGSISLTLRNVIVRGSTAVPDPLLRLSTALYFLRVENSKLINPNSPPTKPYAPNWSALFTRYPVLRTIVFYGSISGTLPATLPAIMTSFYVSNNSLTGTIPSTLFSLLPHPLEISAYLDGNSLTGSLPPALLANRQVDDLSLNFARNQLSGTISPEFLSFNTTRDFQYASLVFRNNKFEGTVPQVSSNLLAGTYLLLDFSYNRLSGNVPTLIAPSTSYWKLRNLKALFKSNAFTGTIPNIWDGLMGVASSVWSVTLDYSNNLNSGSLQSIGPNTSYSYLDSFWMDVSSNALTGTLPTYSLLFQGSIQTATVNASYNQLAGSVPLISSSEKTTSLSLSLTNNRFEGPIRPDLFLIRSNYKLRTLTVDISSNRLEGLLNTSLFDGIWSGSIPRDVTLDMSNCSFYGSVPNFVSRAFGSLTLNLSRNSLNGTLPSDMPFSYAFTSIDLSDNQIDGTILIPATGHMRMENLSLARNLFTNLTISPGVNYLFKLDISGNANLTGDLPSSLFMTGSRLIALNVSGTAITGPFPNTSIFNSSTLVSLDLSRTSIDYCALNDDSVWLAPKLQRCDVTSTNALDCLSSYPKVCDPAYRPPVAPIAPGAVPSSQTQTPSTSSPDEPISSSTRLVANLSLLLILLLVFM